MRNFFQCNITFTAGKASFPLVFHRRVHRRVWNLYELRGVRVYAREKEKSNHTWDRQTEKGTIVR